MGLTDRIKSSVSKVTNRGKEDLNVSDQFANWANGSFSLRVGEFITDILGDSRNTPHDEMRDGWRMMQNDIQVDQSIEKKSLLIWGEGLTVDTDDQATKEFFDQEVIPKLQKAAIPAGKHGVGLGNGYIEVIRGDSTGVPKDFEHVNRPHKMYPQYGSDLEITGYVLESFKATDDDAQAFDVLVSDRQKKRIKGSRFEKDDIIHLKVGSGAMPKMGRSSFLSGIDDYKIKRELKRFHGVSARYKMTPRKAFVFNEQNESTGIDEPGDTANSKIRREREKELNNLDEDENPVYHDVDLDVKDYSYDPQMRQGQEVIDSLTKDLTSPLPEFASNHTDGPRTPSRQPMNLFQMELSSVRLVWESEINPVLQEIAKARGYDESVTLDWGDFNFPTRDERTDEIIRMFNKNLLTLGQAVQELPYDVEVPAEYEDKYNFELDTGGNPFDSLQQKLDDIENLDQEDLEQVLNDESET